MTLKSSGDGGCHRADDPYWLVSLKSAGGPLGEVTHLHRVDDRTGKMISDLVSRVQFRRMIVR